MNNMTSITKQGSQTPIINAVRGDQNTRAFTFVVERYDGETDLAELVWVLQTKNAAGMTDATALYAYKTDKNVQLTWTIGGFATEAEGRTTLQLMGFDEDQTVQWSSGMYYMEVSRAISPDKSQTGTTGQLKELVLAAAVRADEAAEGAKAAGEEAINIVRTEYERMQADVDAIKPIAVMQRTPMFPKQKVDGYIYNVLDNSTFGNGESYRGYAIYDVQAGETYLISGSSSANAEAYPLGAFWHDYSDWAFSFFGTDATKVYTDLVVTAPENATKMVVNLNSAYGVLKVDKQINLTQRLDIVMEQDYSARTLDGVITDAKKNPFAFKEYDKGYISFVFDDLPAEIDEIASIFEEYGMPLCLAAIPERLGYACEGLTKNVGSFEPGMSRGAVCAQVVNNGGEVLAHNSDVITAENQHVHEVMYNHFVKTKETLAAQGWPIRGIIRSGGEGQINKSAVIERWVTGNFEYSNYGYAPQHNLERETINQSIADLKAKILKAVNEKSWLRIMAHDYAFGGGTTFTGAADLRAILDYCKSVGIAVVTYAHMVDTFGCSELGKRVTAVEASAQQANEAARNAQTAADNAATEATKIATQAGQQAKETANNAVADLEDFKAGIEDEVSQLSSEIKAKADAITAGYIAITAPLANETGCDWNLNDVSYTPGAITPKLESNGILRIDFAEDIRGIGLILYVITATSGKNSQYEVSDLTITEASYSFEIADTFRVMIAATGGMVHYFDRVQAGTSIYTLTTEANFRRLQNRIISNQKIWCFGDSLTKGVITGTTAIEQSYPYWLGKFLGNDAVEISNFGVPGASVQDMLAAVQERDFYDNCDIAILMIGTNSFITNGSPDDPTSNIGAYHAAIKHIIDSGKGMTKIVLLNPPKSYRESVPDRWNDEMHYTIQQIAHEYGLDCIDLYKFLPFTPDDTVYYSDDKVHFTGKGYYYIAYIVYNYLANHMTASQIGGSPTFDY